MFYKYISVSRQTSYFPCRQFRKILALFRTDDVNLFLNKSERTASCGAFIIKTFKK